MIRLVQKAYTLYPETYNDNCYSYLSFTTQIN